MQPTPPFRRQRQPPVLQYALLAIVFLCSAAYFLGGSRALIHGLVHWREPVRQPIDFGYQMRSISGIQQEALAAGARKGDQVVALGGKPFRGFDQLLSALRERRPGDILRATILRPDRSSSQIAIHLAADNPTPPKPSDWISAVLFSIALPSFCLLVGFWVALAKPRDGDAWLVLGMMLGFFGLVRRPDVDGPLLAAALCWAVLTQMCLPASMMLFGINFPERLRLDIRRPWLKWIVLGPFLALAAAPIAFELTKFFNFDAAAPMVPYYPAVSRAITILSMVAISVFFFMLGSKSGMAKSPDTRRRLRLLWLGSAIGLTPNLLVVLCAFYRHTDFGDGVPQWAQIVVAVLLAVFPLTLAYVVIVQRAMDVRILLRQGTKYAFARQSVAIIRILLALWLGFAILRYFTYPENHRAGAQLQILLVLIVFFVFRFVFSRRLRTWIDQKFFREAYSSEQILSDLSEEARNFTETAPLLETVTARIGQTLHVERIAVFLRSGDTFRLQLATGIDFADYQIHHPALLGSGSAALATLNRQKGPANVYQDDPSSWLVEATDSERSALADLSTELLVPLPGRGRLIGVMALGPKRSEEPYSRSDRQLLQTVASQTGLAIENAELIENLASEIGQRERIHREIEIAREVQERLFPQQYPVVAGADFAGHCRPAQGIGGDYYDFIEIAPPGVIPSEVEGPASAAANSHSAARLGIAIGDVSGKGISAALLMASLRASLRAMTLTSRDGLARTIGNVNQLVYEASTSNRYATFFYAELDPSTRALSYVNAGHNAPALLRRVPGAALPTVYRLEPTGTVVGLLPFADYEQAALQLQPGDVLLAFTDGISEAMTPSDEEWGEDRLIECARNALATGNHTADSLLRHILADADRFAEGAEQHDDMTLLILKLA